MRALLIEDDQFKARRLQELLQQLQTGMSVDAAHSVASSTKALDEGPKYDLVILDMSLPTFDVGPRETGGRPQGFGGREVMRFMQNNEIDVPVIVVTQFERFGEPGKEIELPMLAQALREEFPSLFQGVVYYDATSERWRNELAELLGRVSAE
jgi:CheY-like chemotaxis protein